MPKIRRLSGADLLSLKGVPLSREYGRFLALSWAPLPAGADRVSKVATVVSKKEARTAPSRNRLKRRVREVLRTLLERVPLGLALIIRARPPAARASYIDLREDLEMLLSRIS